MDHCTNQPGVVTASSQLAGQNKARSPPTVCAINHVHSGKMKIQDNDERLMCAFAIQEQQIEWPQEHCTNHLSHNSKLTVLEEKWTMLCVILEQRHSTSSVTHKRTRFDPTTFVISPYMCHCYSVSSSFSLTFLRVSSGYWIRGCANFELTNSPLLTNSLVCFLLPRSHE